MQRPFALIAASLAAVGCATASPALEPSLNESAPPERLGSPPPEVKAPSEHRGRMVKKGDRAFAGRGSGREAVEAALEAWRAAAGLALDPEVEIRLARAEHYLAQTAGPGSRQAHFARGADHALCALRALGVEDAEGCAARAGPAAAPALYWRAENLEGLARESGLVAGARDRRRALCLSQRAAQIAPDYFYAGPLRLLGKLLASTPVLAGGSLEQSRKAFEQAMEKSPAFIPTWVEFAQTWAVKAQDRRLFESALDAAMAQTADPPEVGPENALARQEARALKLRAAELF